VGIENIIPSHYSCHCRQSLLWTFSALSACGIHYPELPEVVSDGLDTISLAAVKESTAKPCPNTVPAFEVKLLISVILDLVIEATVRREDALSLVVIRRHAIVSRSNQDQADPKRSL